MYRHTLFPLALVLAGIMLLIPAGAAQQADCQTFSATGKTVCGLFLRYWREHGGLAQQGYPLSGEFSEQSQVDGKTYTVQYFERAVFERHPENAGTPYEVLLTQLGTYQYQRKYPTGNPADPWATLRQRPLQIPAIAPGSACPTTPGKQVFPAFAAALGSGPIYPVGLGTAGVLYYGGSGFPPPWSGNKVLWVGSPSYKGPVLIRGHQIDGPNELRFEHGANPPQELQLDTREGGSVPGGDWSNWPSYTRVRAPGCYAYQVDGTGFTAIIFFKAVDAPGP
ncbi:MAG: hypothetical protein ACR2M0_01160 [Chloroflexia bacterium]